MSTEVQRRENNRADVILDAAALLFANQGFHKTTIRDITGAVDMLPGGVYYHFGSKVEILLAVYREGVRRVIDSVERHLAPAPDQPWERLRAAVIGHIEAILAPSAYARVIVTVRPDDVPDMADELKVVRDEYEQVWKELVAEVSPGIDATLFRLLLLGAANSAQLWYRADGLSPGEIGNTLVDAFRLPMGGGD